MKDSTGIGGYAHRDGPANVTVPRCACGCSHPEVDVHAACAECHGTPLKPHHPVRICVNCGHALRLER